jgi:NitT/TauT family transport system substrate-binding protein
MNVRKSKSLQFWVTLAIFLIVVSGCAPKEAELLEPVELRFVALRILDSLPMYVAESQGYFDEYDIEVELIPVGSAPERDQLVASGQADGMINELTSTVFANRDAVSLQVVRFARAADAAHPVFRLLASAASGITDLEGLKAGNLGISEGTIIEYVTDRLLEAEGYLVSEYSKVNIPGISDRLALLNSGELASAVLPEPASTLAEQGGAVVIIDDSEHPQYGFSTIAFRTAYLDENPEAVKQFLAAIEKAVADINADPEKWNQILIDAELIPPPLVGNYPIPPYIEASVPSEAQYNDVVEWGRGKGLIEAAASYQETVVDDFLP